MHTLPPRHSQPSVPAWQSTAPSPTHAAAKPNTTPTEESQRDARAFDRQLAEGATRPALEAGDTLAGYLPSTERIGYIDDFELVAFDEELKRRPAVSVSR